MVFVMIVTLKIRDECVAEFLEIMKADAVGSRTEPGCVRFDLLQSGPNTFVLYEAYENDAAAVAGTHPRPTQRQNSVFYSCLILPLAVPAIPGNSAVERTPSLSPPPLFLAFLNRLPLPFVFPIPQRLPFVFPIPQRIRRRSIIRRGRRLRRVSRRLC